jgi:Fic family protein
LSSYALKGTKPGEKVVLRGRREIVQHAAAFQHMINAFVKHDMPMSERLIRETHGILVEGLGAEDAGVFNLQTFGGTYRHGDQKAYAGTHEYTRPADVPKAMKSLVESLEADLQQAEKTKVIDPFMLAAKYCDRFVNIHLFKDANGRMCRLILNAILMKYAGLVVCLGEKGADRDEYLRVAQESTSVGGHAGQLGNLVLESAVGTLRRLKATLTRQRKT